MRTMQISSPQWRELKSSIAAGSAPAGFFLVQGPSEEIAVQAQAVLEDSCQRGYPASYFLCSGSGAFQLPCFWPFPGKQPSPESLEIRGLFQALGGLIRHNPMLAVLEQLEPAVRSEPPSPQIVLLEHLTPPSERDLAFSVLLLRSVLPQHISLVMLIHQQSTTCRLPYPYSNVVESMLFLLYISGGRLRRADWQTLLAHFPEQGQADRFISSRQVGSDVWVCYANRQVAELAEDTYRNMEPGRRQELARSWWQFLPHHTGYPLLAIVAETDDQEAMLSVYSLDTIQMAFLEPEGLVRYYDRVQQLAHTAGEASVSSQAEIVSLAAQVLLRTTPAAEVYEKLQGVLPGATSGQTATVFWSQLAQALIRSDRPADWEYALECHRLCLAHGQGLKQETVRQLLAGLANGEALIAYKQRQAEKARELAEFALAQLKGIAGSLLSQLHSKINLGDVYLHLLGDVEAAITQYREALLTISEASERFKQQFTPEYSHPLKQRAALKLANARIQAGQYAEAIEILEHLLRELHMAPGLNRVGEGHAKEVLKTTLALAQAYLKGGQVRKAALCYWHILRHPQWLEPVALREAGAKLRDCRPAMHERLQRRMDRIVSEQEAIIANAMQVVEVLTGMQKAQKV